MKKLSREEIYNAERKIGLKAGRIIKKALKKEIIRHALVSGKKANKYIPLIDSVKTLKPKMGAVRLFSVQHTMARHGFIINQGVDTKRSGGIKVMKKTGNRYLTKEHRMVLKANPFISDAIDNSNVLDFLFNELAESRTTEFNLRIDKMVRRFNNGK